MTTRAEAAARYAAEGVPVFPCRDKQPLTAHGFKDATTDAAQVRAWWTEFPDANIGGVPGRAGWVVVDVDGPEGEATAAALALPPTRTVRTGRGRHLYYQHPGGGPIGNKPLGSGLDVRADAGYVMLPPSVHPSGSVYAWEDAAAAVVPFLPHLLNGASAPLAPIPEHSRNTTLLSLAGVLRTEGAPERAILAGLRAVNAIHGKGIPDTELRDVAARYAAPEGERRRFTLYSVEELAALPDPDWLVAGMVPAGGMAELVGRPGVGKTFVALDLALRIATAEGEEAAQWFGRAVRPGRVLYVSAEGQSFFRHRITAALANLRRTSAPNFLTMLEAVDLVDVVRQVPDFLAAVTARTPELALVVLDTRQRCTPGSDENASDPQGKAIASIDRLRQELGCAVLTLHHPNAQGSRLRGWTGWDGAMDAILELEAVGSGLTLTSTKVKDGPAMEPLRLRLVGLSGSAVVAKDEEPEVGVRLSAALVGTLRALGEGLRTTEWEEVSQIPHNTFYRHRKHLVAAGAVAEGAEKVWTVTPTGAEILGTAGSTAGVPKRRPKVGTGVPGGRSPRYGGTNGEEEEAL